MFATGLFRLVSGFANNLGGVNVSIASAAGATTTPLGAANE